MEDFDDLTEFREIVLTFISIEGLKKTKDRLACSAPFIRNRVIDKK
jgi:hypothetical protein